jgi:hypothetical protein
MAWGQTYGWRLNNLSIYQIFPLLGLLAFSLMWVHYIAGVARRYWGVPKIALKSYFDITSAAVLALILLHPVLLAWQLWSDGAGLPPGSELNYVVPSARWAILFGFAALTLFLLFELRRKLEDTRWWLIIEHGSNLAMVLIFFHALKLGGALQIDWFRFIWYFYGVTFVLALLFIYGTSLSGRQSEPQPPK